jgi:hypothetical protein
VPVVQAASQAAQVASRRAAVVVAAPDSAEALALEAAEARVAPVAASARRGAPEQVSVAGSEAEWWRVVEQRRGAVRRRLLV